MPRTLSEHLAQQVQANQLLLRGDEPGNKVIQSVLETLAASSGKATGEGQGWVGGGGGGGRRGGSGEAGREGLGRGLGRRRREGESTLGCRTPGALRYPKSICEGRGRGWEGGVYGGGERAWLLLDTLVLS